MTPYISLNDTAVRGAIRNAKMKNYDSLRNNIKMHAHGQSL